MQYWQTENVHTGHLKYKKEDSCNKKVVALEASHFWNQRKQDDKSWKPIKI
jgi:hypothetical protein